MTDEPRSFAGSMAHAHWKRLGTYRAWCRKELPDPQLSKVKRYCDDECRQADEQLQHDQTPVTRGELASELSNFKRRLEALEQDRQDTPSPQVDDEGA